MGSLWLMASPGRRRFRSSCLCFEPGDDTLAAGPDPAICPVVVVTDDPAGVVTSRCADGGDAAAVTFAKGLEAGQRVREVWHATTTRRR
jgi:hypothetical protein